MDAKDISLNAQQLRVLMPVEQGHCQRGSECHSKERQLFAHGYQR
jgi:hypothetical protein